MWSPWSTSWRPSGCLSRGDRRAALASVRSPADALLLLRISCVAVAVPALMRLPLPALARLLQPRFVRRGRAMTADRIASLVDVARVAGYPAIRQGCQTRAVTLYWFLARAGLPVELRFGIAVDGQGGSADGHAWVSLDGRAFLEKEDPEPRFAVTYRVPAATA